MLVTLPFIIIGMLVTLPFNYIYGISGIEVDIVWVSCRNTEFIKNRGLDKKVS